MLKSRRGLLAAGLAVAVVGTLGAASTLSAGAEQIPAAGPAAPAAAPAAVEDGKSTPPPLLPWGARPQKVKKGAPGATSKMLRAAGLTAAAADTSGSVLPKPVYGAKGRIGGTTYLASEPNRFGAPPEPPDSTAPDPAKPPIHYHYSRSKQYAETDGAYANLLISKPALKMEDYHSLAEIAVQSADGKQIVEVGWNVDREVNGDADPHLFVYHWVNRQPTCYACDFVQVSKNIKPGDTLPDGVPRMFGIQYFNSAWWIAFDSEWVGYFPEKLWNDKNVSFNRSGLVQMFGEVATPVLAPSCSQMGNGLTADNEKAARVGSISYINGPTVAVTLESMPKVKDGKRNDEEGTPVYTVGYSTKTTTRTFRFGGPGSPECKP